MNPVSRLEIAVVTGFILVQLVVSSCGRTTSGRPDLKYDAEGQQSLASQLLAPSSNDQRQPDIDGTRVVWSEKVGQYWQVIMLDVTDNKPVQLTADGMDHVEPTISGDLVIWQQGPPGGAGHIAGVNLSSGAPVQLPNVRASHATINGMAITWAGETDLTTLKDPIVLFDIARRVSIDIVRAPVASWPSLDGNILVWEDERNGNSDIYAYDLSSGSEFPVVVAPKDQRQPNISGSIVVWQDNRNGVALNDNDIYAYDISGQSEFVVSARRGNEYDPAIDGKIVVWTDAVGGNMNVYGYDLSTRQLFTVAADNHGNSQADVSGLRIVWVRADRPNDRNAHTQIAYSQMTAIPPN